MVSNANRAVSNMADMMKKQNSRLSKLESVVKDFEIIAVDSLQGEINSLEKRKRELALEMDTIELTLQSRRSKLEEAKAAMRSLNSSSSLQPPAALRNGGGGGGGGADGMAAEGPPPPSSSSSMSSRRRAGSSRLTASSDTGAKEDAQSMTIFSLSAASRPSPCRP